MGILLGCTISAKFIFENRDRSCQAFDFIKNEMVAIKTKWPPLKQNGCHKNKMAAMKTKWLPLQYYPQ